MATARILIVEDDAFLLRLLKDYLAKRGYHVDVADNAKAALDEVRKSVPDLIISDVVMPGMDGYELVRRLRHHPPTSMVPIILLTALGEISNKITGFETGADDYVVKPFDLTELELRIKALLARRGTVEGSSTSLQSKVLSVFSLRGGVGKSTLAVNLAISLARLWGRPVPLLDMALNVGHVALMMDLHPKVSLANLAHSKETVEDIDAIKKAMLPTPSGVQVLAAPPDAGCIELIDVDFVSTLIDTVRGTFSYLVIDTQPTIDDVNLAILEKSDQILLILAHEMASVLSARRALDIFSGLGFPAEKTSIVINGVIRNPKLPRDHIQAALGYPILTTIPHDPEILVRAIDQGVPAVLSNPNSAAPGTIEILAYHLSQPGEEKRLNDQITEALARVKKRLEVHR